MLLRNYETLLVEPGAVIILGESAGLARPTVAHGGRDPRGRMETGHVEELRKAFRIEETAADVTMVAPRTIS